MRDLEAHPEGTRRRLAVPAVAGLAGLIYLLWEVAHRAVFAYAQGIYPIDDADEWRYTACSRLVEHGHALFSEVFSAQPPLLFTSLAAGMHLFGDSIAGARWVEIGFGLVSLMCAAWLAWLLAGPVAGAATAFLLAISPGFLVYSHTVEAEGPMMALITLSLALALLYAKVGRRIFPLLAGLSLGGAMLLKLFAAEAVLPGLWLIVLCRRETRPWLLQVVSSYLLGATAPLALDFALLHPRQQWDQVIRLHERAARVDLPGVTPPLKILGQFLALDLGLTLLAAAGLLALLLLGRWKDAGFLASWLLGTLVMLLLFRPLFPHHAAILLSSLAVCAGTGIALGLTQLRSAGRLGALPVGVSLLAYLVLVPRLAHDDRHFLVAYSRPAVSNLAGYVRSRTSPGDFVAVDDLAIADAAHRLVPPPLCDPSNVRLRAGYLTARDLIGSTQRYRAALVLPSFGIYQQVPAFVAWLRQHYRAQQAPDGKTAFFSR